MYGKFLQGLASPDSPSSRGSADGGVFCAFGRDGGPGCFRDGDGSVNRHSRGAGERDSGREFAVGKRDTGWEFITSKSNTG